ncbi:MAG: nucleoside monophosphate kinase [Pleurocapsa minor GSE-CHR-MK-17-07R]|jgi:adenylate kinase|nr:nucleoside monophosphate kinase [Pleurocapsa minor GSE-CHR-MK 17-07R]
MSLFVLLIGVQGAGKGEQARFITQKYGIPQLSTGDLFRAMKTRTDDFARRIQQLMAEGKLIDDETTCEVVRERLALDDAQGGVIFDGFPRTPAQADWLAGYLQSNGHALNAVILLDLDLYSAFKRAYGRVSAADGKTYNYYFNRGDVQFEFVPHETKLFPPRLKATLDGQELNRRPDDASADAVIKRIDTFVAETAPLVDYYKAAGTLHRIDAAGSIADVSAQIDAILSR